MTVQPDNTDIFLICQSDLAMALEQEFYKGGVPEGIIFYKPLALINIIPPTVDGAPVYLGLQGPPSAVRDLVNRVSVTFEKAGPA